jgi:hypothetical protein
VIVPCSKRLNWDQKRVQMSSWNVLEESGRVENFHNGSELCDLQNRGQGITPSGRPRGCLPDEALFLVQILDLGVTTIGASARFPVGWLFQNYCGPEVGFGEIRSL